MPPLPLLRYPLCGGGGGGHPLPPSAASSSPDGFETRCARPLPFRTTVDAGLIAARTAPEPFCSAGARERCCAVLPAPRPLCRLAAFSGPWWWWRGSPSFPYRPSLLPALPYASLRARNDRASFPPPARGAGPGPGVPPPPFAVRRCKRGPGEQRAAEARAPRSEGGVQRERAGPRRGRCQPRAVPAAGQRGGGGGGGAERGSAEGPAGTRRPGPASAGPLPVPRPPARGAPATRRGGLAAPLRRAPGRSPAGSRRGRGALPSAATGAGRSHGRAAAPVSHAPWEKQPLVNPRRRLPLPPLRGGCLSSSSRKRGRLPGPPPPGLLPRSAVR